MTPPLFSRCPDRVTLVDVSARDGLQSQPGVLAPDDRARWILDLLEAGVPELEAGSFVDPQRVPQMAGTDRVLESLQPYLDRLWVLALSLRGLTAALSAGARNLLCLVCAADSTSLANQGRTTREVLAAWEAPAAREARERVRTRAAVAVAWHDPAEGAVAPEHVLEICRRLQGLGFPEITLCDTSGHATPRGVAGLLERIAPVYPPDRVGLHLHNAGGLAAANALVALLLGVRRFDTAIGGLGGCPFTEHASANLDTGQLVHLLQTLGVTTGIDADRLAAATGRCLGLLGAVQTPLSGSTCPAPVAGRSRGRSSGRQHAENDHG